MIPGIPPPRALPVRMPRHRDNLWRKCCRGLLYLGGWRLQGELPDHARLVVIGAPHSSLWDGFWCLLMKVGIGAEARIMIKRELFRGPLAWILRKVDALPVDRHAAVGVVGQMTKRFASGDPLWLAIAPEGTRKPVQRWKTGFWRIARAADVPIFPVALHYPEKRLVLGPLLEPGDDMEADIARLRAFFAPYRGKHHGI